MDRVVEELRGRPELLHVVSLLKLNRFSLIKNFKKKINHCRFYSGEKKRIISSLHKYLHKLFKRDHHKGQKYHERQISLYAEFDRPNLLPFLRDSTHCPLEKVRCDHDQDSFNCPPASRGSQDGLAIISTCSLLGFGGVSAEELCGGDRLPAQ